MNQPPSRIGSPTSEGAPAIRLAELVAALSHALDLTEGQPDGHCVRCCWIGVHIGRAIGLSDAEIGDLYYTLLLKDLGCSSNAARVCNLFLTDDLAFKREAKLVNDGAVQALRFILGHTGRDVALATRVRTVINVVQHSTDFIHEIIDTRCHRGAQIARDMRFSAEVAGGIQALDEHWDGRGQPDGLAGERIPVFARIALMAQVVDVFQMSNGREAARREIHLRSGTWFDPRLVAAFERVADASEFWDRLASEDLETAVHALQPVQNPKPVDEDYLDEITSAFAQVVDSKSPYTHGHSERVAMFADAIAEELGFDPARRRWLMRAARLHDIGKLGVSNTILDKSGKPTPEEWQAIRMHAVHTERILGHVSAFADMAEIAAAHHERLDGNGYPKGLRADEIAIETRVITTADIFEAVTAKRPYRDAMPVDKALALMAGDVGTAIDPACFAALKRALGKRETKAA